VKREIIAAVMQNKVPVSVLFTKARTLATSLQYSYP